MIHGSGALPLVLVYLSSATGLVTDSFDAGVEDGNVTLGGSLSLWCGLQDGASIGGKRCEAIVSLTC